MINWNEKYSVLISKIDDQHQTFFELLNKLESVTQKNDFTEQLPMILNEIVEYTGFHFKTEEDLMKKAQFSGYEKHKKIHDDIKTDIYLECKRIVEKDVSAMDVMWLYNYMREWINTHILEEDMKYKDALKDFRD